ncbi:DUF945 family protein [Thiomonas sp. FB-6]|uniref:DUF945 family protein n=1 Tax=Thiomonas sp. FB-6 TaxID=1158291 RepID=UPI00035C4373|nr:DUF945 family protein [Thiomonas sp. FB-6]
MAVKFVTAVAAAAVVLLGAALGLSWWAGGRFEHQMRAASEQDLGEPGLRMVGVVVHRGLFSSSASAVLNVPAGLYPVGIPLSFTTSQGLALDGSVLRVQVRMGDLADTPLRAVLAALNDTQDPFRVRMRFGLTGQLDRVAMRLTPIDAQLAQGRLRLAWEGMRLRMRVHGFYARGGSADGELHWAPVDIDAAAPASAHVRIGAIDETFTQTGRQTNAHSTFSMNMGPTTADLPGRRLRIDSVSAAGDVALHRAETGFADNPSGLRVGRTRLKDFDLRVVMSEPAAGELDAKGELDMPLPGQPALHPGMSLAQIRQADQALLAQLSATLDLRASAALLQGLPAPTMDKLLAAGYIVRQGADAVSHVVFGGGHVTVNGHLLGS